MLTSVEVSPGSSRPWIYFPAVANQTTQLFTLSRLFNSVLPAVISSMLRPSHQVPAASPAGGASALRLCSRHARHATHHSRCVVCRGGNDQKNSGLYFTYEEVEPEDGKRQELMPGD